MSTLRQWSHFTAAERDAAIEKCRRLIRGKTQDRIVWKQLAEHVGCTCPSGIRRVLDRRWKAERNSEYRKEPAANYKHLFKADHNAPAKPRLEDIAARLAEIPPDTRTPAQQLLGDPIPSRSALARRL